MTRYDNVAVALLSTEYYSLEALEGRYRRLYRRFQRIGLSTRTSANDVG